MTLINRIKQTQCWSIDRLHSLLARIYDTHRAGSHSTDTDIDHTEVLHILADDRRRYALEYLAAQPTGKTVSLSDLAEVVAARENDCSIEAITSTQRERVYIAFYQQHSETLAAVANVDTDRKTFTVIPETKRVWKAYTAFHQELTG